MTDPQVDTWVVKKSQALNKAWTLNTVQQRQLQHHLQTIDRDIRMKSTKHHVVAANTKDFFKSINPTSGRNVVCPFGLSREQADNFREIKRGKLPSMTLEEFDQRLTEAKQTINSARITRHVPKNHPRERKLSEFKIKRTLFKAPTIASNARRVSNEMSVLPDDNTNTSFPLYKRKLVAAAAYNRLAVSSTCMCTDSAYRRPWSDPGVQSRLPRITANRRA